MQVQEQVNHRSLSGSLFSFFLKKIGRSLHADKARHRSHRTQDDESLVNIQRTFSLTVTQSEEKNAVIDRHGGSWRLGHVWNISPRLILRDNI